MVSLPRQIPTSGASRSDHPHAGGRGGQGASAAAWRDPRPLPSLDTPLGNSFPELERRAAQGDAKAACRIAAEYEYCDALRSELGEARGMIDGVEEMPAGAATRRDVSDDLEAARSSLATRQQDYARHCGNAPSLGAARRATYWRQGALAGHLPALRHYAIGNAFRFRDLLDAVPELEQYRREAESLATRAARAGDATMIYALAMAYAEGSDDRYRPFLAQAIAPDPAAALAWFRRLDALPAFRQVGRAHPVRRSVERHLSALSLLVSPHELASAEAALGDTAQTTPGGLDELVAHAYPNGGLRSVDRAQCDRDAFLVQDP